MFVDEKQQGEAQTAEQANRKLKLSEAVRLGARLRPQCFGDYYSSTGSCALGAAYEAILGRKPSDADITAYEQANIAEEKIRLRVIDMNDHGKTREQIADWLQEQGY